MKTTTDPVQNAAALLGRRGGLAKSDAKQAASRENGKLGGRPRALKRGKKKAKAN